MSMNIIKIKVMIMNIKIKINYECMFNNDKAIQDCQGVVYDMVIKQRTIWNHFLS